MVFKPVRVPVSILAAMCLWSSAVTAGPGKPANLVVDSLVVSTQNLHGLPAPESGAEVPVQASAEPAFALQTASYAISPGDILDFQSFDDPSISRPGIVVLHDGTATFPLIDDINLKGMTRDEANAVVREAYRTVFRDPQFALRVQEPAGQLFYVLGDVSRSSQFPYVHGMNVLEAINIAGGLRVTARSGGEAYSPSQGTLTKAFVIRRGYGEREVLEVDLRGLTQSGPHPSETPVFPGDIVYVPEGVNLVYVLGQVANPNVYQLTENQTLMQLISRAGGFTESTARLRHIVLMRPINATETEVLVLDFREMVKSGSDYQVQPGDIVYIPRKNLVRVQEFVNRFTGSISPLLDLYTNAYNAVYLDRRTKAFLDSIEADDNQLVNSLQNLRELGTVVQDFTQTIPQTTQLATDLLAPVVAAP